MVNISVIIPAYNEEKRIENTIKRCLEYFKKNKDNFELIVVNDGSKDKTEKILKKYKKIKIITYYPNKGKGYAVKQGMLKAKGDYILFSDADLSAPIEEIKKLREYIKDYDIIIASRAIKGAEVKTIRYRKLLGRLFALAVNLLAVRGINDTQCGFKLFTKKAAKDIFSHQKINGWAFDVEVLFLAKKFRYNIKEVGVKWKHFNHDDVNPAGHSLKMLREIVKIRWNNITGKYKK